MTIRNSTNFSYKNHLRPIAEAEGFQGIEIFETFTEVAHTLICDFLAPAHKSLNSSYQNHLPTKVQVDGLQGMEVFETLTKIFQTLICDFRATMIKSTNSSDKVTHSPKLRLIDCKS